MSAPFPSVTRLKGVEDQRRGPVFARLAIYFCMLHSAEARTEVIWGIYSSFGPSVVTRPKLREPARVQAQFQISTKNTLISVLGPGFLLCHIKAINCLSRTSALCNMQLALVWPHSSHSAPQCCICGRARHRWRTRANEHASIFGTPDPCRRHSNVLVSSRILRPVLLHRSDGDGPHAATTGADHRQ